jgi:hypothetical protein
MRWIYAERVAAKLFTIPVVDFSYRKKHFFFGKLFGCMYWRLPTDVLLYARTLGLANSPNN